MKRIAPLGMTKAINLRIVLTIVGAFGIAKAAADGAKTNIHMRIFCGWYGDIYHGEFTDF